ncbi:MAG: hypothetical protein UT09_C0047G0003 [Parcubacteria group bacterium GW2011_GWF2_38_8]|nr:MAG: hypothetical protein UT09_C0047G0003 [Parcubacteria group bacterium GW2011_GWF2_38_8]
MSISRTQSGRIQQKRGDTLVKTIEKQYKVDLGYRSDAKLSTVLKKEGASSLSKLIKMTETPKKRK